MVSSVPEAHKQAGGGYAGYGYSWPALQSDGAYMGC
jgi:hypothetical protein